MSGFEETVKSPIFTLTVYGLLFVLNLSSTALIKLIKKNQDNDREQYREYKRDTALCLKELIDCKNDHGLKIEHLDTVVSRLERIVERYEK